MSFKLYDALILGAGPAGLSVALALARVKRTALVLSHNHFRNSETIHNVLGSDGDHPTAFRAKARDQIKKYGNGIEFADGEAIMLRMVGLQDGYQAFEMEEEGGKVWRGRKMVLAMGARDVFPDIEGCAENWPDNIYENLFYYGYERSKLPIGLMGFTPANGLNNAVMICHMSGIKPRVTVFTNGPLPEDRETREAMQAAQSIGCVFDEQGIVKLTRAPGWEMGVDIHFIDGESVRMGFLVDKPTVEPVGQQMIVDGLGVEIVSTMFGSCLKRDEPFGETSVKGCFVAGDAGTPMTQISIALAQGVAVASGVSAQLCAEEGERALTRVKNVRNDEVQVAEPETTLRVT